MKVNVTPPRVLAIYSAPTRIDRGFFLFLSLAVTFYLLCWSHPILCLSQPEIKLSENTKWNIAFLRLLISCSISGAEQQCSDHSHIDPLRDQLIS